MQPRLTQYIAEASPRLGILPVHQGMHVCARISAGVSLDMQQKGMEEGAGTGEKGGGGGGGEG